MEATTGAMMVAGMFLLVSTVQISASPTTPLTVTTTASTNTPAASAAEAGDEGVYFCFASEVFRLAAPPATSWLRLGFTPPPPASMFLQRLMQQPPCRLRVVVPAHNFLRLSLVPDVADDSSLSSPSEDDDDEDDDEDDSYAGPRSNADTAMDVAMDAAMEEVVKYKRDKDIATSPCTLTAYKEPQLEAVWSVDLCDKDAVNKPYIDIFSNLSLVWSPPQEGKSLRARGLNINAVRRDVEVRNLCSVQLVQLAGQGLESSMRLKLEDLRASEDRDEPCRVTVATPPSHRLSLLLVSNAKETTSASTSSSASSSTAASDEVLPAVASKRPICTFSLRHGCTSGGWDVDLCDPASSASINFTEFFSGNVTLEWRSPPEGESGAQLSDTVVLTAVGIGDACSNTQHFFSCSRRRRSQALCVSAELVCDGYNNCPMDGVDEDPAHCAPSKKATAPPHKSQNVVNRTNPDAKDTIFEFLFNQYKQEQNRHSNRHHDPTLPSEPSPDTLSNYGPWGYLMLGMLVCGAFLMLCGLWECCCRQPKATPTAPSHTPTTVLMPQVGLGGGVLVLDSDLEDEPPRPPAYEDLDQPPSYGVLFPPGQPKDDVLVVVPASLTSPTVLVVEASFADADDVPSLHSSSSSSSVTSAASLAPS